MTSTILDQAKLRRQLLLMQEELDDRMNAKTITPDELWIYIDDMMRLAIEVRRLAGRPVRVYKHVKFPHPVIRELTREEI